MNDRPISKQSAFKELLQGDLFDIVEVHSGLSAKLAERAGFEALWASSFAISSLIGVRDCDEASPTEILSIVDWIAGATNLPLIVDGNSGFGSFNSARRFASELARRGAAAVCFEDKQFPKRNSFLGQGQELLPIEEFCGVIAASIESTASSPFSVIARTEALIADQPMSEAIKRAEAYADAGAHAILIHSRAKSDAQVVEFARNWSARLPLIVVPTTYPDIDRHRLFENGVSGVIWANHALRASASAISNVFDHIKENGKPTGFEELASVNELFSILDYSEFEAAERRFLPKAASEISRC